MTFCSYELWDTRSGNALGDFVTKDEALVVVRETIQDHGREAVQSWLLSGANARGRSKPIALRGALAELAMAADNRVAVTT